PASACDGIPRAKPLHPPPSTGRHSCFRPSRFTAGLLHRYDGAAFSRKTCNGQGFGRLGWLRIGVAFRGPPGRVAVPIGEFFAAARPICWIGRPLILAALILALDADMEMIVVPVVGAHLGEPGPVAGCPAAQLFLDWRMDEDARNLRIGRRAL